VFSDNGLRKITKKIRVFEDSAQKIEHSVKPDSGALRTFAPRTKLQAFWNNGYVIG
jgi:hypothetical protein